MSDWFSPRRAGALVPSFDTLQNEVNRVFSDFGFATPTGLQSALTSAPKVDVLKTQEGGYEIHAELPGVEEGDIDLSVEGNVLTLSGERRVEREQGRGDWRVRERSTGAFSRAIALPFEAQPDQVDAEFRNGVLTVRVARPPEPQTRGSKVAIRSAGQAGAGQVSGSRDRTIEGSAVRAGEQTGVSQSQAIDNQGGFGAVPTSGGASGGAANASSAGGMLSEGSGGPTDQGRGGGMIGEG